MSKAKPAQLTKLTLDYYEESPQDFWLGTKDHDVTQNYQHFLSAIAAEKPLNILDFGCGPGRDLKYFADLGHNAYGLDGCEAFCQMAKTYSNCEVLQQNFINLELQLNFFHGIFANASLFHVPKSLLLEVLQKLHQSLSANGILFSSNPRGQGESVSGGRYANFMELDEYTTVMNAAGFSLVDHYYRPEGLPVEQRPWLACVFKRIEH